MSFDSYYGFRPYVPVAERRRQADQAAKKLGVRGRLLSPVRIEGRAIATTFWGQAWCKNLEGYSDYANRLPRGRAYVRNGSVIDLRISSGTVTALVQGSSLYTITVKIKPLKKSRWDEFRGRSTGQIGNMFDLLQGRLPKPLLADLTSGETGLFPSPGEIDLGCSCPDWADMCKHVAAVLYGVGARLDHDPTLFFTLRGVDMQELITAASTAVSTGLPDATSGEPSLAEADLSSIFGVEVATATPKPALSNGTVSNDSPNPPPKAAAVRKIRATGRGKRLQGGKTKAARIAKPAGPTPRKSKGRRKASASGRKG